jgi:hypothetical protein
MYLMVWFFLYSMDFLAVKKDAMYMFEFVDFLLARKTQLQKLDFLQKSPGNKENYKEALLSSGIVVFAENAAPAKPAAPPPKPWTGRLPFATRESTPLGA